MESKANIQLESALDNNQYDESQLISIRIPVSYLPYYSNSVSFERVEGQVEIQGIVYKYVKRRIYNDSLELRCIPNQAVMKLKAAKDEFYRFLNDLQHTGTNKSNGAHHVSSKNISAEYYPNMNEYRLNIFYCIIPPNSFHYLLRDSHNYNLIVEQPPDHS